MNQKFAKFLLKSLGWTAVEPVVPEKKCVILGAPHTSAWDFPICYLYYASVGGTANIFIKKEFFFWPVGPILRHLGAIPVDRSKTGGAALMRHTIEEFSKREYLQLAIAPEGTRKAVSRWKLGFHKIATEANVPVYLGYFDWKTKTIGRGIKFELTDNPKADLEKIQKWYHDKGVVGKHPDQFSTGY